MNHSKQKSPLTGELRQPKDVTKTASRQGLEAEVPTAWRDPQAAFCPPVPPPMPDALQLVPDSLHCTNNSSSQASDKYKYGRDSVSLLPGHAVSL